MLLRDGLRDVFEFLFVFVFVFVFVFCLGNIRKGNQNYEQVTTDVFLFLIPFVFVFQHENEIVMMIRDKWHQGFLFSGSSLFHKCIKCTEGPIIS